MTKAIVIVESPAKVKTINKILGKNYKVVSSMGHLVDLPKSTLGVDIEKNFQPSFIVVRSKQKILTNLKKESKSAKEIYVATDPDREGEAIGWNLINHIGEGKKVFRVTFQEITKEAVLKAFEKPREFDIKKIDAQVARRILDRIVGYKISPILWKKVGSRLSAGRVQSVALRLIVEREREIKRFVPKEYWQILVDLKKPDREDILSASLEKYDNEKLELGSKQITDALLEKMKGERFIVSDIAQREIKRKASPPLITSTLQQEAFNKLKFNANKTMMIAQQLYEGMEVGDGESVGLITYMRTDSVNISQEAMGKVRQFIKTQYGDNYLPDTPNVYKSKKSAQEAHEAIRPSDVLRGPETLKKILDADQYKLYEIIWNRFVSSQMVPAVYQSKKIEITAGKFLFGVNGSTLLFDGFLTLEREEKEEEKKLDFSHYQKGDHLELKEIKPSQHFTKPPPRFSDASLVKALEEDGIGRPSTYASIIQTLAFRNYVLRDRGYFTPTELGITICDLLVEYFPKVLDVGFTARMEENLDLVEEGKLEYPKLLQEFYQPFKGELDHAENTIVKTHNFIDKKCPECGRQMAVKWGRRGKFLSCSGFPQCKFAQPITSGIKCPQEGCGGELVKRQSKKGMPFYGCSHYPKCTYVSSKPPEIVDEAGSGSSQGEKKDAGAET
ncbi:MAG TPA: type I DNA topoisomerase [Candidatus Omnitrophica bacterium]|nr:MAG: DNA topoisomerase I [Omnitrophica WOR_2 bacterium GWA2_45_18]HBR15164.1 type I DNA topoisomerase [Candidatus Omnitrophota bacterium]